MYAGDSRSGITVIIPTTGNVKPLYRKPVGEDPSFSAVRAEREIQNWPSGRVRLKRILALCRNGRHSQDGNAGTLPATVCRCSKSQTMRSAKPMRTICCLSVGLVALTGLLCLAKQGRADHFTRDPVELLRRSLRASPNAFLANDPELAKRISAIKQPEERIKAFQEARERDLSKQAMAIRSIGDMSRALVLQEWMSEGESDERAGIVRRVRSQLAERFRKAVTHILEGGGDTAKIAVMSVLSELPVTARWQEYPGGVARVFAPQLAQLAKSDRSLTIRLTAARTLGQIFPDPSIAAPALEGILKSAGTEDAGRRPAVSWESSALPQTWPLAPRPAARPRRRPATSSWPARPSFPGLAWGWRMRM